jgi:hypothetical protein
MEGKRKPIRLSEHAKQQLRFRGATEQQVIEGIRTSTWEPAQLGRLECRKDFIAADYDADGRLAGIEILDAVKRLGDPQVFKQVILEDIAIGRQEQPSA